MVTLHHRRKTTEVDIDLSACAKVQRSSIMVPFKEIYASLGVDLPSTSSSYCRLQACRGFSPDKWLGIGYALHRVWPFIYFGPTAFVSRAVVSLIVFGSASTIIPSIGKSPRDQFLAVTTSRAGRSLRFYQLWFFTRPAYNAVLRH